MATNFSRVKPEICKQVYTLLSSAISNGESEIPEEVLSLGFTEPQKEVFRTILSLTGDNAIKALSEQLRIDPISVETLPFKLSPPSPVIPQTKINFTRDCQNGEVLVVWENTSLGDSSSDALIEWMKTRFPEADFLYEAEVIRDGTFVDQFFWIAGDISKFIVARFQLDGMRWFTDVVENNQEGRYPWSFLQSVMTALPPSLRHEVLLRNKSN